MHLFDTGVETLLKTMFKFGESPLIWGPSARVRIRVRFRVRFQA
jgi:hypothetical protein